MAVTTMVAPGGQDSVHFVPSRVEGLSQVTEVAVFPDRLEMHTPEGMTEVRFLDIAQPPPATWLFRLWVRLTRRRVLRFVGERDWFHPPSERYFRFFTKPALVVYMPDEQEVEYGQTLFRRVQEIMAKGGFITWDLG